MDSSTINLLTSFGGFTVGWVIALFFESPKSDPDYIKSSKYDISSQKENFLKFVRGLGKRDWTALTAVLLALYASCLLLVGGLHGGILAGLVVAIGSCMAATALLQ